MAFCKDGTKFKLIVLESKDLGVWVLNLQATVFQLNHVHLPFQDSIRLKLSPTENLGMTSGILRLEIIKCLSVKQFATNMLTA